ncbi:ISAzo13-like element transposase-related protein, partial [Microcystis aeruginosa]|uniref:ISAzo13-like element transposase-related protein n=1 Tax=Microcystis aeruginosa TaxID=1126 RepID=UPI004059301A
ASFLASLVRFLFPNLRILSDLQITAIFCIQISFPTQFVRNAGVERTFGWLEQHWKGSLLDSVETVLRFAESLTFKGKNPVVKLIDKVSAILILKTKEDKVLYVNKRTSV